MKASDRLANHADATTLDKKDNNGKRLANHAEDASAN
jgi:hypothetical protein